MHTLSPPTPSTYAEDSAELTVLKNADRMAELRTPLRATITVAFDASPIARVMRRDWNLVSAKLYIHALNKAYRDQIEEDAMEMNWQIDDTYDDVSTMPWFGKIDKAWLHTREMQIDVVHPIAATWLRSMVKMDEIYASLICAEKSGLITLKKRRAIVLPCQISYLAFKATALKMDYSCQDSVLRA